MRKSIMRMSWDCYLWKSALFAVPFYCDLSTGCVLQDTTEYYQWTVGRAPGVQPRNLACTRQSLTIAHCCFPFTTRQEQNKVCQSRKTKSLQICQRIVVLPFCFWVMMPFHLKPNGFCRFSCIQAYRHERDSSCSWQAQKCRLMTVP